MSEAITTAATAGGGRGNGAQAYVLERIAAIARRRLHKNALGLMSETVNPLWNIDERKAQLVYDWARSGNYAQIQYLYSEIEDRDPTLGVCVTRRTSAVAELDWRVVRSDQRRDRKADGALAKEQIECVETAIAKIDNMPDALEHLALSAFRGFSAVAPVHGISGGITHFDLLDGWNLCYDRMGQSWLWNPSAASFYIPTAHTLASAGDRAAFGSLERIPREAVCVVTRKREIDWPAMQIYLRLSVGERDWGRFLETYGLPPVIITMPPFTSKEEQEAYVKAAESVFEGRSGVVPNGSEISWASESRGTNPFTEFIEHQQKLIVMMATGGTLATLSEATGIGGGASDVQQDEWRRIIRADKRIISNAFNKQVCEPILRAAFPGKPILAEFQLDDTPKPTPKEMLELASAAASAGFEMDADELSEAIGYRLKRKDEGGGMSFDGALQTPRAAEGVTIPDGTAAAETDGPTAENAAASPREAAPAPSAARDGGIHASAAATPSDAGKGADAQGAKDGAASEAAKSLVRSLQADFRPVADRLAQILALPADERAGAAADLMRDLDSLVPDDPQMAEVIAEEMRRAFDGQMRKDAQP